MVDPAMFLFILYGRSTTGKYTLNPLPNTAVTPTTAPLPSLTTAGPICAVRPLGKTAVPIRHPRLPGHCYRAARQWRFPRLAQAVAAGEQEGVSC